jgi:hypothetical protein
MIAHAEPLSATFGNLPVMIARRQDRGLRKTDFKAPAPFWK